MVGALWTGISGLAGAQRGLDNESNNIANVNTLGYKASRISFADQMYQDNIGKGVSSFDVEKLYTQGNLKVTGVGYDMALSGDGFFQVSDGNELYYTRAGNFRMGEDGNLQTAGELAVQGWAMSPIQADTDVTSTDSNATMLTNDYNKLLGNVIIRDTTEINTIVAKATDYTETASSDSVSIYSGFGQKTAASKISDVETLITEYNKQLSLYANADPKPGATESIAQKDKLDFGLDTAVLEPGDKVYIIINGDTYSETIETTEEDAMKLLIDKISNKSGFNAYYTDGLTPTATDASEPVPRINTSAEGRIVIESLVPGIQFTVQEFGWTKGDQTTKGTVENLVQANMGTGMGAIESVEEALAKAVSGEQQDVYTNTSEFGELLGTAADTDLQNNFTYQITIYDKELKMDVKVPATPLSIIAPDSMSDFADAINSDGEMSEYVNAYVINGNLIVQPKSDTYDVEFSNTLQVNGFSANRGGTGGGTAPAVYDSFNATSIPRPDGDKDYFLKATLDAGAAGNTFDIAIDDPADIDAVVAAINADNLANGNAHLIAENIDGKLVLYPSKDDGSGAAVQDESITTSQFRTHLEVGESSDNDSDATTGTFTAVDVDISKSALYSGSNGAGAEFMSMTTSINQTATKSDIQLRLDSLAITDSAFGDFSVDDTGLITIQQDGAQFAVGQVAIAKFTDNRGLDPAGDNLMSATNRSGQAIFNVDNDKTATIKGGTLELSTADLSESLVNLMVFQRAFEANAKSITTADQILTTLIQLKR